MKQKYFWGLIGVLLIVGGGIYVYSSTLHKGNQPAISVSYKDGTYMIEGAPARYFGNDATGDLNGDGAPDVAFIVTTDGGGSGTFYYVIAALSTGSGYQSTNAILLGDRIAPQTTEIKDGEVIVNYADRKPSDPMTTPPSVGVSKYLKVEGTTLVDLVR